MIEARATAAGCSTSTAITLLKMEPEVPQPRMTDELVGRKIALSVLFDTVSVEIICGDDYEAQVLYDDLVERLQAGEGITLSVSRPKKKLVEEE